MEEADAEHVEVLIQNLIKQFFLSRLTETFERCRSAGQNPDFTLSLMKLSIRCLSEALIKHHQVQAAYWSLLDSITDWSTY